MADFVTTSSTATSAALNAKDESPFLLRYWQLTWYLLIFFSGTFGNLLVCLVIYKSSSIFRSTPFNMYLCSLAVADLLLALIVLPNYLLSTPIFNHPSGVWGDVLCKTVTGDFLNFYFSEASEYSLVLISLERLKAIGKFPMSTNTLRYGSKTGTWLAIAIVWMMPLATGSPKFGYFLEYKGSRQPVIGSYCTFVWGTKPTLLGRIYAAIILCTDAIIPVIIFFYSFFNIWRCLVKQEKTVASRIRGNTYSAGYRYYQCWQIFERRRRTVRILMVATLVFVVCWVPNRVMFFLINHRGEKHARLTWNSQVYQVGILLGFTGSCVNPYLYAWQSKEFRRHCKEAMKCLIPTCPSFDFGYKQFDNNSEKVKGSKQNEGSHFEDDSTSQSESTTKSCKSDLVTNTQRIRRYRISTSEVSGSRKELSGII